MQTCLIISHTHSIHLNYAYISKTQHNYKNTNANVLIIDYTEFYPFKLIFLTNESTSRTPYKYKKTLMQRVDHSIYFILSAKT